MKVPSLKIPAMKMPGFVAGIAGRVSGIMKSQPPGRLAAMAVTAAIVGLLLLVSVMGGEGQPEASTVLKIKPSEYSHSSPSAATPGKAMSLIASNGAVISEPELIEMSVDGPLPKIARDGRTPMSVYARRTDKSDPRPKIALIVGGLGMSQSVSQLAVDGLPAGVTLSFSPYGSSLQGMVSAARANGHEVLLEVPLEPFDYPNNDPGQNTLLAAAPTKDNIARVQWVMSRVTGYAGLMNSQGSKFLSSATDAQMLLEQTHRRGLYFIDNGQSDQSNARDAARAVGISFARADKSIDAAPAKDAIDAELAALEKVAIQRGSALGVSGAYPVTIERVKAWSLTLEQKGLALVPVSALVVADKTSPAKAVHAPSSSSKPASHGKATVKSSRDKPAAHDEHEKPGPHP